MKPPRYKVFLQIRQFNIDTSADAERIGTRLLESQGSRGGVRPTKFPKTSLRSSTSFQLHANRHSLSLSVLPSSVFGTHYVISFVCHLGCGQVGCGFLASEPTHIYTYHTLCRSESRTQHWMMTLQEQRVAAKVDLAKRCSRYVMFVKISWSLYSSRL